MKWRWQFFCFLQNQAKGGIAIRTKQHFSPPDFKYSEYILCTMSQFLGICWHHCVSVLICFYLPLLTQKFLMLYSCMILEQLHLKTKVFKLRVASTTVLSINLTWVIWHMINNNNQGNTIIHYFLVVKSYSQSQPPLKWRWISSQVLIWVSQRYVFGLMLIASPNRSDVWQRNFNINPPYKS